jgi:hypothetical protein
MEQDWAISITYMKRSFIHSIDTLAEGQDHIPLFSKRRVIIYNEII